MSSNLQNHRCASSELLLSYTTAWHTILSFFFFSFSRCSVSISVSRRFLQSIRLSLSNSVMLGLYPQKVCSSISCLTTLWGEYQCRDAMLHGGLIYTTTHIQTDVLWLGIQTSGPVSPSTYSFYTPSDFRWLRIVNCRITAQWRNN